MKQVEKCRHTNPRENTAYNYPGTFSRSKPIDNRIYYKINANYKTNKQRDSKTSYYQQNSDYFFCVGIFHTQMFEIVLGIHIFYSQAK